MEYLLYLLTGLTAVLLVLVILLLVRQNRTRPGPQEAEFDRLAEELRRQQTVSAGELSGSRWNWMTQWAAAPSGWPRCSPTTSG